MRTTTEPNESQRRGVGVLVRLMAATAALVVATAVPAAAHGAEGELEVGEPEVGAGLEVTVPLRLTYAGDGHAAEAEEVGEITVVATQGDQEALGEVVPEDAPGVYEARVVLPAAGAWDVTITATEPAATATVTVDAAEAASEPDETTTTEPAPPTTAESEPETSDTGAGEIVDRDDDGGSSTTPLIVAMVVCLVVAVGAYVLIRRARARGDA